MPSAAERTRRGFEHVCRAAALAALALLLWRTLRPPATRGVERADGTTLPAALARWTHVAPDSAIVTLAMVPEARGRDWLRAIVRAGTPLSWREAAPTASESPRRGGGVTPFSRLAAVAASAEPVPLPRGGVRVRVSAPAGTALALRDAAGLVDSFAASRGGTTVRVGDLAGALDARTGTATARAALRDSLELRPVLLLGAAGWEAKFTLAALEEDGWRVHARLRVSPTAQVTQGSALPIDTSRYAAVVALDSVAAADAGAIGRFVRQGGGLVLAGAAARAPAFAALRAGAVSERVPGIIGAEKSESPRDGLALVPVSAPRADAVPLEARGRQVAVAARRVDAGRVLQVGFEETWRWRMLGTDGADAAHRAWWSELVASVAYAPRLPRAPGAADTTASATALPAPADEAPLAALVDAIGEPSNDAGGGALTTREPRDESREAWPLFTLLAAALLAEWGSRRLRGAR